MSGLENTGKRLGNYVSGKGYMTSEERREKEKAEKQGALDRIYAEADMPDEETIRRNERRKAAGRRGSRQRNVLTADEELLG
jgi:hypothetical protein